MGVYVCVCMFALLPPALNVQMVRANGPSFDSCHTHLHLHPCPTGQSPCPNGPGTCTLLFCDCSSMTNCRYIDPPKL